MADITEFRPIAHEFYPEEFHGAAFVGANAADALWFYRFDSSFIEVRDILTCQDKVFASLSTLEVRQRFQELLKGDEIHIVNVQDAYVGEFHTLVFVVREIQEDRDHVFLWNLLTLHLQLLVSAPRLLSAATVTAQQAITGSNSSLRQDSIDLDGEDDEEDEEHRPSLDMENEGRPRVRIQGNRRQLLVLGHRNGWVTIYKFTVSLSGQVNCAKEPERELCLHGGSVTSFATLSNRSTESTPVIVAGTAEGKVFVIKYDGHHESQSLQVLMALEDLHSKELPITSITLEPTTDENLALLAVGQGFLPGVKESGECPTISIYYLRLQKSDYRLLGYVQPPMMEGEEATGGRTLAATVSEDYNGLRIHCAFSIKVDDAPLRSNLTTVLINNRDVQKVDVVEMNANGGGTLLDISPQSNSGELKVLYLSKMVNYVHAADIESRRQESEWTVASDDKDNSRHWNQAPVYDSFFQANSRFMSDSEVSEIEERRSLLGGKLFYDRLLEFVDVEAGALYPPRSHAQQRNLWINIYVNGDMESDNRNCLAYYLLKNQHGNESEQFLREHMIPPKFVDLLNGFWALDHFQFKNAVMYLSRPGLTIDWVEHVIQAIYEHGSAHLAHQFIVAAGLNLGSTHLAELKMKVLLETDFTEAFYFQRTITSKRTDEAEGSIQQEQEAELMDPLKTRKRLLSQLLDHCFLNKPNRAAIKALSLLTMDNLEEKTLVDYCEKHSGLTREIGQEYLIMYFVNHARYMDAIRMHRRRLAVEKEKEENEMFHRDALERRNSRQQGSDAGSTKKVGLSQSEKRQVLIDNLLLVLPATQRMELRKEQEKEEGISATM